MSLKQHINIYSVTYILLNHIDQQILPQLETNILYSSTRRKNRDSENLTK